MNPYRILDKISPAEAFFIASDDHWFRGLDEAYNRCILEYSKKELKTLGLITPLGMGD